VVVFVSASWLVWLAFMTVDIYLERDTIHMVEGILDRANRQGEDEYMGIYGANFAPLSIRLLSWMAARLPAKALVVVTNLLTLCASLLTLGGMYVAYRREFPPGRLVLALVIVALTPVYGYGAASFHPFIWALGLFSISLALTGSKSPILRIVVPVLLVAVAGLLRKDAILFVPILLERFIGSRKHTRVIWWISMFVPMGLLLYHLLSGNMFITVFWTMDRLANLPHTLLKSLGLLLGMVVVTIRFRREFSRPYLRLVLSWALPSLLFYGANPTPPRHLLLVAYAAGLWVGLAIPLERWVVRGGCRFRLVAAVALLAVLAQSVTVGLYIKRRVDERHAQFEGYASVIQKTARQENLLLVYWEAGDPLFWFWLASSPDHTYTFSRLRYTDPQTVRYMGDIYRFNLSGRTVYTVPGSLLQKHQGIGDIARAARERVSKPEGEFVSLWAHEAVAIDRFSDRGN
jgi:hypothetical protein